MVIPLSIPTALLPNGSHHFHPRCHSFSIIHLLNPSKIFSQGKAYQTKYIYFYFHGLLIFFSFVVDFSHIIESSAFQSVVPWACSINITRNLNFKKWLLRLPQWLSGKESACECRRYGFSPWSRKILHAAEQLSLYARTIEPVLQSPCAATIEPMQKPPQ